MDQFAAGLVGTRTPFGTAPNAFDARYCPVCLPCNALPCSPALSGIALPCLTLPCLVALNSFCCVFARSSTYEPVAWLIHTLLSALSRPPALTSIDALFEAAPSPSSLCPATPRHSPALLLYTQLVTTSVLLVAYTLIFQYSYVRCTDNCDTVTKTWGPFFCTRKPFETWNDVPNDNRDAGLC